MAQREEKQNVKKNKIQQLLNFLGYPFSTYCKHSSINYYYNYIKTVFILGVGLPEDWSRLDWQECRFYLNIPDSQADAAACAGISFLQLGLL